jgi:hypothetical protein
MKNKKALSEVVTVMLMILVVLGAVAAIWTVIYNFSHNRLNKAGSCYNTFEKINLNDDYTCYNSTSKVMQFSISRQNIAMDYLLVSISLNDSSRIYKLYDFVTEIENLTDYTTGNSNVSLPGNESGKTYNAANIEEFPVLIEIAPNINNNQCDVSSKIEDIVDCK